MANIGYKSYTCGQCCRGEWYGNCGSCVFKSIRINKSDTACKMFLYKRQYSGDEIEKIIGKKISEGK